MESSPLKRKLTDSLLILVALFCICACRRAPRKEASPASSDKVQLAAPRLRLEQVTFELGPVVQDEAAHGTLAVLNAGSLPLEIGAIDSSRFCSGSVDPKTIAPGNKGKLDVTCRSDLYGPMRETLTIHSNDPKAAKATLHLVANVTPLLAFDKSSIDLKMFFGEERSEEVHLVGTLVDRARVKLKDKGIVDVDIEPLPAQPGKVKGYRIHCKGRKVGMNVGNLLITTGSRASKGYRHSVRLQSGRNTRGKPDQPLLQSKDIGNQDGDD